MLRRYYKVADPDPDPLVIEHPDPDQRVIIKLGLVLKKPGPDPMMTLKKCFVSSWF